MKYLKSQSGSALITTLILAAVVVIIGAALLLSVTSEIRMNESMERRISATYLAEAGIEHGLSILESTPAGRNPALPPGEFRLLNEAGKIYAYQIIEISNSLIRSRGSEIINGVTVSEVTIEASIDENGAVTVR